MSIVLNFYGSQKGLTNKQSTYVKLLISEFNKIPGIKEFRHCDTIGDVDIHEFVIINNLADQVILYPPSNTEIRGFAAATNKVIIKEEMYLVQGLKQICIDADVMIIAPHQTDDKTNGSYIAEELARKMNVKSIITIYHDGSITQWPSINLKNLQTKIANKKTNNITEIINGKRIKENAY